MKDEIIIYQADETSIRLEVRIEEDTVWLTQAQMADLFQTSRNNITLHISNIFKENELNEISVGKESLLTASDGKKYKTKVEEFDFQIQTNLTHKEGIFFEGQVFDAYVFITDLFRNAKESIIIIDNYIDESVLLMLGKRQKGVEVVVYTSTLTKETKLDLKKYRNQYPDIKINQFNKSHDRFIIIDRKTIYHLGASLKDLGKKWFAFSILNFEVQDIINKLEENQIK